MNDGFDLNDFISVHLSFRQIKWMTETYLDTDIRGQFIDKCYSASKVNISVNAVYIAQYLFEKHNILVFPSVQRKKANLHEGNWTMSFFDGSVTVFSKVPLVELVHKIKLNQELSVNTYLDKELVEIK